MGRVKVNLTLGALGLNMSRVAEAALLEAAKIERNRLWREENRDAINACADEIAQEGLPLARFRSF